MSHKKKENNKAIIPVIIKRVPTSNGFTDDILFSMADVIQNKKLIAIKDDIMKEYNSLIKKIKKLLRNDKPSKAPRKNIWNAGDLILMTRENIRNRYGIDITNLIEAVAVNLGLSKSSVRYIVKFRQITAKEKVIENISWSNYMEAINFINKGDFEKCILLINKGKLRTTKEIRNYVRQKNKEWKKRTNVSKK
ncbi:MAG: hypothetical protein QXT72_04205 [Candidatus Micrarchaeia archaeon]